MAWATLLWALLLVLWVQLTPLYRAADEPAHVDLVLHLLDGGAYEEPGRLTYDPRVRASLPLAGLSAPEETDLTALSPLPFSTTEVPDRSASYDQLPVPPGLPPVVNQMTQHPPLYYGLMAAGARLLPGFQEESFPRQLGALRLLSALLLLPLPALAAAAARRLAAAPAVAAAAALLPLAVPQLAHVGGAVTNDALLALLGAAVAVPLLAVSQGDVSRRTAALTGLLLGLALLTKAFAVGLVAWAALAYGLALLGPARAARRRAVTSALLAAGVALAAGGWWWVANLVRYGALQPQGQALLPEVDTDPHLVEYTLGVVSRLTASTWGLFGWLEVPLPAAVRWSAAVAVVLGLALAVARPSRPGGWQRAAASVALAAFCVQCAVVYQQSLKNYLRGGYYAGLQGRYLFAFVGVVAALVAVGLALPLRRRRPYAPLLALAGVVLLQGTGVAVALRGFWEEDGAGLGRALDVQAAWAPFPGAVTALAGVGVLVVTGVLAARLRPRGSRSPRE